MSTREQYAGDAELPLGSYAALSGLFLIGVGAVLLRASRRGKMPERIPPEDVLLLGVATHKLSRVVSRARVTSPFRAPFAEYEGKGSGGEVEETARGEGLRRAVGQLVTCNYCSGPWVALALFAGYLESPPATRVVASLFAAVTVSDWMHRGYRAVAAGTEEVEAETELAQRAANALPESSAP
jgi:hypothetical protein